MDLLVSQRLANHLIILGYLSRADVPNDTGRTTVRGERLEHLSCVGLKNLVFGLVLRTDVRMSYCTSVCNKRLTSKRGQAQPHLLTR